MKIYFCQAEANKPPKKEIPHVRKKITFENGDTTDLSCSYLLESTSWADMNMKIQERSKLEFSYYPRPSTLKSDYVIDFGKDKPVYHGRFDLNTESPIDNDLKKDIQQSLLYYSGNKKFTNPAKQKEYDTFLNSIVSKEHQQMAQEMLLLVK